MSIDFLRRLPLFAGMAAADLEWLYGQARPVTVAAEHWLMREGEPGDACYIVLDGEFEITKRSDQQDIKIAQREPGAVIGEMSLLDRSPRSASVRALRDSSLLMIPQAAFDQLLSSSPSAAISILHTVSARLRQNEGLLRQSEKMAALGTLSAGLAHELNNPAAAVRRSADQLQHALNKWQALTAELDSLTHDADLHDRVRELLEDITQRAKQPVDLDPLARSDLESDLQTWLEDCGVDEAWDLAPILVGFGWDVQALDNLAGEFEIAERAVLVQWLALGCSVHALLGEVIMGAERISEIVGAVKSYSYLDQAPVQQVDIHKGLENTLVILKHKLKQGIKVNKEYCTDLPLIDAYGSELNQVWTNIIDNAVDAMQGQGEITIRTFFQPPHCVVVELQDTGPGIPPEIQSRIFEAFFTTKPPGSGNGLGLNIAYSIVHKHYGRIEVESQPGSTLFRVTLPTNLQQN